MRRGFVLCVMLCVWHGVMATEGPNLISNSSLETASGSGPQGWVSGRWGTNDAVFTYPASPAFSGTKATSIEVNSYTSGDAKWCAPQIAVKPGDVYHFYD